MLPEKLKQFFLYLIPVLDLHLVHGFVSSVFHVLCPALLCCLTDALRGFYVHVKTELFFVCLYA